MPIFGGIFIGRRHGAFDSTPSGGRVDDAVGPAFPPAGSYNSTLYGEEYPVEEGGTEFLHPVFAFQQTGAQVPNQICDVDVLNDGSGGTYIDWSSATNVQYKTYGTVFYVESVGINIEVPSGSGNYYAGGTQDLEYFHEGNGYYDTQTVNQSYYSNGSDTNIENVNGGDHTSEIPSGSGNHYPNGLFDGYTWDGSGGYNYPVTKGTYYTAGTDTGLTGLNTDYQTEVPSGSGTYYTNGLVEGYTWDGSGGYNYPVTKSNYHTGYIYTINFSTEVPSGSGNNFNNGTGEDYTWDGMGGYTSSPSGSYYSYGTFITNDGSFDYYWDGSGGYYS